MCTCTYAFFVPCFPSTRGERSERAGYPPPNVLSYTTEYWRSWYDFLTDRCKVTRMCDTGCLFQVCLLSRFSLLCTCVGCVEMEDGSFVSFRHDRRLKRGSLPHPEPLVSRLRYAPRVIQIRSQYLHPGDYQPFKVIQGTIP